MNPNGLEYSKKTHDFPVLVTYLGLDSLISGNGLAGYLTIFPQQLFARAERFVGCVGLTPHPCTITLVL